MQMTTSSPAYIVPGPVPSLGAKPTLMKQNLLPPPPTTSAIHALHHQVVQHQLQYPLHRSPAYPRGTPNADTFQPLTIANTNSGTSLLTTNNHNNHNHNNTASVLTCNSNDDSGGGNGSTSGGGGSSGHSLSQSMESINNIGLTDDEVRTMKNKND